VELHPHKSRYWLNSNPESLEEFIKNVKTVCDLYEKALELFNKGIHLVSTDEKTGIQALERLFPTLPMKPGLPELREFEYIRRGTIALICNLEVATGKIIAPTLNPTRTEDDFLVHISQTIDIDPQSQWIFITDRLNTHQSESLVKMVAERCQIRDDLGVKGKKGILKSMETRSEFLENIEHRIRFVYTPKHSSWLNQIEIWFSILVKKLLKRSSFTSVEDMCKRILEFIEYYNKTMSKAFKWKYKGPIKSKQQKIIYLFEKENLLAS
jgi:transposase